MKVRDAIEQLKLLDANMEIFGHIYDGTYNYASRFKVVKMEASNAPLGGPYEPNDDGFDTVTLGYL